jgi:hypothetical protein
MSNEDAFNLPTAVKEELYKLASVLGLERRQIESEKDIMAVVTLSIKRVERMKYDAHKAAAPTSAPRAPTPEAKLENKIKMKARELEENLRISLKSIGDAGAIKAKNSKLVVKVRHEKFQRAVVEKSMETYRKRMRILTHHIEKLLKALRIESAKKIKSLERVRTLEGARKALYEVIAKKNKALASQER